MSSVKYDLLVTYKNLYSKPGGKTPPIDKKDLSFDANGLSQIQKLSNREVEEIAYYIRDSSGDLVKKVTAKRKSKAGLYSTYPLKFSESQSLNDPKNNKIVGVDDTEVGWMIIEKQETLHDFLTRIYQHPYRKNVEEVNFRKNNPHLQGNPILNLYPGDFVIISNSSNDKNKELAKMKKDVKAAKLEFDRVKKEVGFNSKIFASNVDFLHDMLRTADYVALTKDKVKNADKPARINYAAIAAGTSQGIVTFSETSNAKVTKAYTELVKAYEEARKITYDSSGKPVKSKLGNPKKFNSFKQSHPELIKNFDNAFSQSFFKYETGVTSGSIRKQIRNDVIFRSSRYKGGISAYVSNFRKLGKITKITEGGGNILVALSAYDATMNVKNAYNKGDSDNTRKTIITETLKLEGSLAGGWAGGTAGAALATVLIGASTGGVGLIVIGVVAAGGGVAGGYWGGEAGAFFGERLGDKVNSL